MSRVQHSFGDGRPRGRGEGTLSQCAPPQTSPFPFPSDGSLLDRVCLCSAMQCGAVSVGRWLCGCVCVRRCMRSCLCGIAMAASAWRDRAV